MRHRPCLRSIPALALLSVALALTAGCGKKEGNPTVKVAFAKTALSSFVGSDALISAAPGTSPGVFALDQTPTIFKMKLIAMYLVQDIDSNMNNVGALQRIWVSPKCDADLTLCGIGPAAGDYQADWFDFALPAEQVNANLNAQATTVTAGTYNYIRMDFAGATGARTDTAAENLQYGTSSAISVRGPNQQDTKIASPLVIEEGDIVTVNLTYDLNDTIDSTGTTRPSDVSTGNWVCDSGTTAPCFAVPVFKPTASK